MTNPKSEKSGTAAKGSGERADYDVDLRTGAKVIDSIVLRGDLSGLGPAERARFYVQMCEGLGLNPHAQPFAFLRLNGKEILYATRGATDQLAAMHRVTREIIDGPKVIDLGGTKLVYAVCKASMPNGRFETATATVPLIDPVNVLMKAETKAKRRATLSLLAVESTSTRSTTWPRPPRSRRRTIRRPTRPRRTPPWGGSTRASAKSSCPARPSRCG
jgi:hypothetical protein